MHMKLRFKGWFLMALLVGFTALSAECRKKDVEDFPDYNHLEYAKERPPADQQTPDPQPGSIDMEVGVRHKPTRGTSLEALPIPLRPAVAPNNTEPPLDFLDAAADVSTAAVTTAPAQ
jgi:hypothetical protein